MIFSKTLWKHVWNLPVFVAAVCLWAGLMIGGGLYFGHTKQGSLPVSQQEITCPKMVPFLKKSAHLYGIQVKHVKAKLLPSSEKSPARVLLTMTGKLGKEPLIQEYISDMQKDYGLLFAPRSVSVRRGKSCTGITLHLECQRCM